MKNKTKTKKVNPEKLIADNLFELIDSKNYNVERLGNKIADAIIHKIEKGEFRFGNDPSLASECAQMVLECALNKIADKHPSYLI